VSKAALLTSALCLTYNTSTATDLASARSFLFAPGSDERKLARALICGADAVIADLEDAVIPAEKPGARKLVRERLADADGVATIVRINGADSPWFEEDVAMTAELAPDAVVLPKASVDSAKLLESHGLPVIAIIETAAAVRTAYEIATRPGVAALLVGALDLGTELGLESRPDGLELHYTRSRLVVDSAAAGIRPPIDAVNVNTRDLAAVEADARLARSLGLRGKACIHPAQVPVVNEVFSPSAEELDWARRVLSSAAEAESEARGAVAIDGRMVDAPVIARAKRILHESERRLPE
jgi:citrate lyase beta subunit